MDAVTLQLTLLAALLQSHDYHVRESVNLTPVPMLFLQVGAAIAPDLTARLRCSQEIELRHDAAIAAIHPPNGEWPRLDILHYIDTDKHLLENGPWPQEWAYAFTTEEDCCVRPEAYRRATAAYVGWLVRQGRSKAAIMQMLEDMAAKEFEIGPMEHD